MIKTILFKITLALWFIFWAPFMLLVLPSKKLTRWVVTLNAKGVLGVARIVGGIKTKTHFPVEQVDGIPLKPHGNNIRLDGKLIIAAKHMSILEVAVLETSIPNSFFIVKRELLWIPIYGWSFWRMGLQPVNRAKGATNMKALTDAVAKKILDGGVLIVFPEGTRTKPGKPVKLKRGLMFIAESLKLPILPVGTDSGVYWPKKGKIKSGTANVYIEPMLPCSATLDEIGEAINRQSA